MIKLTFEETWYISHIQDGQIRAYRDALAVEQRRDPTVAAIVEDAEGYKAYCDGGMYTLNGYQGAVLISSIGTGIFNARALNFGAIRGLLSRVSIYTNRLILDIEVRVCLQETTLLRLHRYVLGWRHNDYIIVPQEGVLEAAEQHGAIVGDSQEDFVYCTASFVTAWNGVISAFTFPDVGTTEIALRVHSERHNITRDAMRQEATAKIRIVENA